MRENLDVNGFPESQTRWTNKHEFLRLPLANLDLLNRTNDTPGQKKKPIGAPRFEGRQFS